MDKKIVDSCELEDNKPSDRIITEQLGVWRILIGEKPSSAPFGIQLEAILSSLGLVVRLFTEIYKQGPGLFILVILGACWSSIEDALLLYFSSRLLTIVSVAPYFPVVVLSLRLCRLRLG
jgi:hypothetical protein